MKTNSVKLSIFLLLFLFSCSNNTKSVNNHFDTLINQNKCKEAAEVVPVEKENLSFFNNVRLVSGTAASYTISLGGIILTLPLALLDLRFIGFSAQAGKKIFKGTEGLRCPNLDSIAYSSIKVSKCFAKKNTFKDLLASKVFMQSMLTTDQFYKCISTKAKRRFNSQTESLRIPLAIAADKNIHIAANNGKIKELRLYIKEGASVNLKDKNGNTPLHLSTKKGLHGTSQILYNYNADPFALNNNGDTPYDFAKKHLKKGNRFFVELFQSNRSK